MKDFMNEIINIDKKKQWTLFILLSIWTIILSGMLISNFINFVNSEQIVGTVVNTEYSSRRTKKIIYQYNYNNQIYNGQKYVYFSSHYNIGDIDNIRINPEKPKDIINPMNILSYLILAIFSSIIPIRLFPYLISKK